MLKLTCLSAIGFAAWFVFTTEAPVNLNPACRLYANAASAQAARELSSTGAEERLAGRERLGRLEQACQRELGL